MRRFKTRGWRRTATLCDLGILDMAISLIAVLLLARSFNCFAVAALIQRAADCCLKGKCAPTANSDEVAVLPPAEP